MDEAAALRTALEKIASHPANSYDNHGWGGGYGIGVTDGHRLCAKIAKEALSASPAEDPVTP